MAGVERDALSLRRALLAVQQQAGDLSASAALHQLDQLPRGQRLVVDEASSAWLRSAHDLRQRLSLAGLLLQAALFRQESRGGHFRLDAPAPQPFWCCHTLQRWGAGISTEPVAAL